MSVDVDKGAACPRGDTVVVFADGAPSLEVLDKKSRSVRFPNENQLVTKYFEPANPWHNVPTTSRAQLAQEYLLSCRQHSTPPIDSVLQQIRELPENSIGGAARAARLTLADCSLEGAAPADALEALLRKVQFHRVELDHAEVDDEGAEALFDMIEYYESACVICITGPRQFGIRGWQAASRMIKKSAELSEVEVSESALEGSHAPVLARALRPHTCRLRALCLQRARLSGEALMCLVIALKSNGSIRELRLPDNSLSPHDAQQLGSLLRFNNNIQLLDLSNNIIQDSGVGYIADAIVEQAALTPPSAATSPISPHLYPLNGSDSKGLAFLVLWNNQLTRNCAQHLSKALRTSHSLCVLNIGRNALGTEAVRSLSEAGSCGALLSLGLQCARLGPDAGAPLADLLRASTTKLQRLDLRDNRLGPAGLQALLNAMKENHTLTQLDLDDPAESLTLSADDSEAATNARLTRDIRALCRRNEPPAGSERRVHRKISLTCSTAQHLKSPPVCSSARSRLRSPLPSPAPSPAGSPLPHHQNVPLNRFSVTRVTPERESSTESSSPTTPTRPYCSTPSRFRVVQVAEPPSIHVQPAHKRASRFSVTRNYDSIYNPSPRESPSASPTPNSPSPSVSPCPSDASYSDSPRSEDMRVPKVLNVTDSSRSEDMRVPKVLNVTDSSRSEDIRVPKVPNASDSHRTDDIRLPKVLSDNPRSEDVPKVLFVSDNHDIKDIEHTVSINPRKDIASNASGEELKYRELRTLCDTSKDNLKGISRTEDSGNLTPYRITEEQSNFEYAKPPYISPYTSSIDRIYDYPSITTLSGVLYNRSVAEMSTTTLCPERYENRIVPDTPITITSSRSEPKFGPALFVEPTVVPNSRFSISPSPVSFIPMDYVTPTRQNSSNDPNRSQQADSVVCKLFTDNESRDETQPSLVNTERDANTVCSSSERTDEIETSKLKQETETDRLFVKSEASNVAMDTGITEPSIEIAQTVDNDQKHVHVINVQDMHDSKSKCIIETKDIVTDTKDTNVTDMKHTPVTDVIRTSITDIKNTSTESATNENVREDIVTKGATKVVDFASKPENVIFFIADEPIICTKVKSDTTNSKTYSDVLKSEPYQDKTEQLSYEQEIDDGTIKTETKLVKNSVQISESEKKDVQVEVSVKTASVLDNTAKVHSDKDFVNIDDSILVKKDEKALKNIKAITEDLGNLIQEMKDMSVKKKCTVDIDSVTNNVPASFNRDIVLKKNKSESSLDSPDLEVSRLMHKKLSSPFRDSSSSLEISGSSMESLNAIENAPKKMISTELDRRKETVVLSTESSVESTSEVTPVNTQNFLYTSVSSNDSVSPLFQTKKIHGSLSSLEASVSSLDSKQDKIMVTSADSGIEHSIQNPSEGKEDASSNEGTLTLNSSLRETVKQTENIQETLTSPKRASSLLDVPALKTKGLDRMRKISWVAPSPSFHIPRVEPEKAKEEKPSHLEKLLSLFQHPTSLFSRSQSDDERKSASNTPPRKDSSLTSSFWSWGSAIENKEEKDDSSEATDSTLSERVQVSFVDESFSKKLDSKTPSTDTDNTLSEFQSVVTETTDVLVQKVDLSVNAGSDVLDLSRPNDNVRETKIDLDDNKDDVKPEVVRPRSFAAVLKDSGSDNSMEKQPSPDAGQMVDKLPVKVIRGIKENISPENTLTASMSNAQALAVEMKHQPLVNALWEVPFPALQENVPKADEIRSEMAPIATIEETSDIVADNFSSDTIQLAYIDDVKADIEDRSQIAPDADVTTVTKELDKIDLGKDALSYLMYENQDIEPDAEQTIATKVEGSLAQELKDAEIKEMNDLSPELVVDEAIEVFHVKEVIPGSSPVILDRAKIKKSNSLEDLSQRQENEKSPKTKAIAFKVPETSPCDIPERRTKLRSRSGSSPKSLPESLNKPCPLTKMETILSKKKKKVSSLGKIARDSLLALNMSDEEIAEFRRSYKLTSVESLRSLESVSEDANSQSGTSIDSRCRSCLRNSQESLMSLDSMSEDCKCADRDKARTMR